MVNTSMHPREQQNAPHPELRGAFGINISVISQKYPCPLWGMDVFSHSRLEEAGRVLPLGPTVLLLTRNQSCFLLERSGFYDTINVTNRYLSRWRT